MAASNANSLLLQNVKATPLETGTLPPGPTGMRRNTTQDDLQDTDAWTIIDGLLHVPGVIHRRGPLSLLGGGSPYQVTGHEIGLAKAERPNGQYSFGHLSDSGPTFESFDLSNNSGSQTWPTTLNHSPYSNFWSRMLQNSYGAMIGTADDDVNNRTLGFWGGALKTTIASSSLSSSVSVGDNTVVLASGGSSWDSGMWVFNSSGYLVGQVKSVSSNTLTLTGPALVSATSTVNGEPIRGINPRVTKGAITCSTTTTTVNGGDTKFLAQGLGSGTWDLFTQDLTFIGTVSSVTSDVQLTLTGDAAVDLLSGNFIAVKRTGSYALTNDQLGYISASYAGRQWYAKGNTLYFSDTIDPEGLDLTDDGDSLEFSQDPIRGIVSTLPALVVPTSTECYALIGALGTVPSQWSGQRIHDDGAISPMCVVPYKGGAIWAGQRGIWFWNGADPVNVVDAWGDDYRKLVLPSTRVWGGLCRDHYFLFVSGADGTVVRKLTNGGADGGINDDLRFDNQNITLVVNLLTGASSVFSNVEIRGWQDAPAGTGAITSLMAVTESDPKATIVSPDQFFVGTGHDAFLCDNSLLYGPYPDLYVETKRYGMGDGQRLKLFKMLLLHFLADTGNLQLDTVAGLNEEGETASNEYEGSSEYQDQRIKFMRRSQFLAFRVYESSISGDVAGTVLGTPTISIASPGVVTLASHGLVQDQAVTFATTGTLPSGIVAGQRYFAYPIDANTFHISVDQYTSNLIDTGGSQSGTHTLTSYGLPAITDAQLGPWAVVFKWKRPGRV